jgi:hypothetical protein
MLKIHTSNNSKGLENIKATYEFPENGLSPWEQINWMNEKLPEFKGEVEITIKTFSPYILNLLNLWLKRGELGYENLEAWEEFWDEDTGTIYHNDLKIQNPGVKLVNTKSLSDPISYIYDEYDREVLPVV